MEIMPFVPDSSGFVPDEAPAEPSGFGDNVIQAAKAAWPLLIPGGSALKGVHEAGKLLEQVGYGAGGKVTDLASNLGASPEIAAGAGTLANVSVQSLPALIPGGQVAKAAAPAFETAAKSLMQIALRPTQRDFALGKGDRAIETMLNFQQPGSFLSGVNPTRSGVAALKDEGIALNKSVEDLISKSGGTVDKNVVGSKIQSVIDDIEKSQATPQDARAMVERVYDQFLSNSLIPKNVPVTQAQEIKQGIYRMLKEKYGQVGTETVAAQKSIARGFKEGLEAAVPEVSPLNKKASDIWNAINVAERRAYAEGNKSLMGLTPLVHDPLAALGFWAARNSEVMSILARVLHAGKEQIPATSTRLGIAGYESTTKQE